MTKLKSKPKSGKEDAKVLKLPTTLRKAAEAYVEARETNERLRKEKAKSEEEVTNCEAQLVTEMDKLGLDFCKMKGLGSFKPRPDVQVGTKAETFEDFKSWLRKQKHGDIIKETIHHGTLKSWYKEMMGNLFLKGKDQAFKEELIAKGFISVFEQVKITWTREKEPKG